MKLVKLASISFTKISDKWSKQPWEINDGEIIVAHQINTIKSGKPIIVASFLALEKLPEVNSKNQIIVPSDGIIKSQKAIENIANMISVTEKSERNIKSLIPSFAFWYETEQEKRWLNLRNDADVKWHCFWTNGMSPDFDNNTLIKLADRPNGIKILTEAHTHRNSVGKYREFVRLFESGFERPFTQIGKKLSQFLENSNFLYNVDEINKWISFRHPVTHADKKGIHSLLTEVDIQKYIPRIEQAAYDVLLNKKTWNNFSRERRNLWEWDTAIVNQNETVLRGKVGRPVNFQINMIDEFDSYLCDLEGRIKLPKHFWTTKKTPTFPVKIEILP